MDPKEQPSNADLHKLLHKLHDRIADVERRLVQHYTQEHASFDEALGEVKRLNDWVRGGRVAARIIVGLAAFITAMAAAYAWVRGHFIVTPK